MAGAVAAADPPRQRGLPPVVDARTRILILGSFPGVASLAASQYYAHPRNHFWPIMGEILGEPLPSMPYAMRLQRLNARGVGLWDSIVACRRRGSADGAIRLAERGNVERVSRAARSLVLVCFNGNTAASAAGPWRAAGYETLALPSTSPAYTRPFAEKLAAWREMTHWIGRK